jgi:mevalonate kinase
MDQKNYKSFSSKVLLFGEYMVLNGGKSLSFPYKSFSLKRSQQYLLNNKYFFQKLVTYIEQHDRLSARLSRDLRSEVDLGLNFESNIPVGYGLGSSGALVAAIYDDFFIEKASESNELKTDFADLECFFHDKSSGIDPLTSYLNKAILSSPEGIQIVPKVELGPFSLFDSGIKRTAKEAIRHFNKLLTESDFKNGLSQLAELSDIMIERWLNLEDIADEMKQYSALQLINFKDFIPAAVEREWRKGLDTNEFYLKLCGAGMGGMYLKYQLV